MVMETRSVRQREMESLREELAALKKNVDDCYIPLMELTSESLFLVDRDCRYLYITNTTARNFGKPAEAIIGKSYGEFHRREVSDRFAEAVARVIATGSPVTDEHTDQFAGKKIYRRFVPVMSDTGSVAKVAVIGQDITKLKEAESALQESEAKYVDLYENAPDMYLSVDARTAAIRTCNNTLVRMTGFGKEAILGRPVFDLYSPDCREDAERSFQKFTLTGEASATLEIVRKDGGTIDVSERSTAVRDKGGNILYSRSIWRDITELRQMREERKEHMDRLRKVLGATVSAMAAAVETRDPYTAGHQRRVADLARSIAKKMDLHRDQIDGIRLAGTIHDIGKISIPSDILNNPVKLNSIEFSLIKEHVQAGYDILKDIDFPWPIPRMVLEHHERLDGSGYPHGSTGDKLLIESRIIAVADVVEAISSHRPYRPGHRIEVAFDEITDKRGILYEPEVVDACLNLFREDNFAFAS